MVPSPLTASSLCLGRRKAGGRWSGWSEEGGAKVTHVPDPAPTPAEEPSAIFFTSGRGVTGIYDWDSIMVSASLRDLRAWWGWREGEREQADLNELSLPWFALLRSDEIIPVYHRDRSELIDLGLDKGVFVLLGRRDVGHCLRERGRRWFGVSLRDETRSDGARLSIFAG